MTPKSKSTYPGCTPGSIAQSKMDSNIHSRYLPWQQSSNPPHMLNSWSHSTRMTYARSTDTYSCSDTDSPTMASSPTKCSVRTTSSPSVTPCRSVDIHSRKVTSCSSHYLRYNQVRNLPSNHAGRVRVLNRVSYSLTQGIHLYTIHLLTCLICSMHVPGQGLCQAKGSLLLCSHFIPKLKGIKKIR